MQSFYKVPLLPCPITLNVCIMNVFHVQCVIFKNIRPSKMFILLLNVYYTRDCTYCIESDICPICIKGTDKTFFCGYHCLPSICSALESYCIVLTPYNAASAVMALCVFNSGSGLRGWPLPVPPQEMLPDTCVFDDKPLRFIHTALVCH